jgi:hypothetical protein
LDASRKLELPNEQTGFPKLAKSCASYLNVDVQSRSLQAAREVCKCKQPEERLGEVSGGDALKRVAFRFQENTNLLEQDPFLSTKTWLLANGWMDEMIDGHKLTFQGCHSSISAKLSEIAPFRQTWILFVVARIPNGVSQNVANL